MYSNHYDENIKNFCDQNGYYYKVIPLNYPLYEQIFLPIAARLHKIELFHYLGNTGSILIRPSPISIITVCDTIFWEQSVLNWLRQRKFGNAYRYIVTKIQRKLSYKYIFISNYTKNCYFENQKNITSNKVIYLSGGEDVAQKLKYPNQEENYLCAMGAKDPRKNSLNLIQAFIKANIYKKFGLELIIFGFEDVLNFTEQNKLQIEELKIAGIKLVGYVTEQNKKMLIKNSKGFVYLSQSEGFGIPIVEAEKLGKRCLVSSTTSCGEIAGSFAILSDPLNQKEIISGLQIFCSEIVKNSHNNILVSNLIIDEANNFSWRRTAQKTERFYLRLLNDIMT